MARAVNREATPVAGKAAQIASTALGNGLHCGLKPG